MSLAFLCFDTFSIPYAPVTPGLPLLRVRPLLPQGSSLWPAPHTRLPAAEFGLHAHRARTVVPASEDVLAAPVSAEHVATEPWTAPIWCRPGWRSNQGREETSSGSFPFSSAIWSRVAGAFPALEGGPDRLFVVSSLLPGSVSSFILGAMPAPSSPLILGPEEKTGLGNVLSSPPPPPPPQGPSALSHCGADGAGDQSPTVFF